MNYFRKCSLTLVIAAFFSVLSVGNAGDWVEMDVSTPRAPLDSNSIDQITEEFEGFALQEWLLECAGLPKSLVARVFVTITGTSKRMRLKVEVPDGFEARKIADIANRYCEARRAGFSSAFIRRNLMPRKLPEQTRVPESIMIGLREKFPGILPDDVIKVVRPCPASPYLDSDRNWVYFVVADEDIGILAGKTPENARAHLEVVSRLDADIALGRGSRWARDEFKKSLKSYSKHQKKPYTVGFWIRWEKEAKQLNLKWISPRDLNPDREID